MGHSGQMVRPCFRVGTTDIFQRIDGTGKALKRYASAGHASEPARRSNDFKSITQRGLCPSKPSRGPARLVLTSATSKCSRYLAKPAQPRNIGEKKCF